MVNFKDYIDRFWINKSKLRSCANFYFGTICYKNRLLKERKHPNRLFRGSMWKQEAKNKSIPPPSLSRWMRGAPLGSLLISLFSSLALSFQTSFSLPLTSSIGIESLTPSLRAPTFKLSIPTPPPPPALPAGTSWSPAKTRRRRRRRQRWSCICNCITAAAACAYLFHWIAIAIAALELSHRLQLQFANSETPPPPPPYIYLQQKLIEKFGERQTEWLN